MKFKKDKVQAEHKLEYLFPDHSAEKELLVKLTLAAGEVRGASHSGSIAGSLKCGSIADLSHWSPAAKLAKSPIHIATQQHPLLLDVSTAV